MFSRSNFWLGKDEVKLMKKIIIPIIAAAILGVGAGVTALMMNRANVATADEPAFEEVEVKSGKYYLNDDTDSDLWIVVTPETISLKGDDIEASLREVAISNFEGQEVSEQAIQDYIDAIRLLYCEEKPYFAEVKNLQSARCVISVDRYNRPVENREDLRNTNAAFLYEDTTDTIYLAVFGAFTLVE